MKKTNSCDMLSPTSSSPQDSPPPLPPPRTTSIRPRTFHPFRAPTSNGHLKVPTTTTSSTNSNRNSTSNSDSSSPSFALLDSLRREFSVPDMHGSWSVESLSSSSSPSNYYNRNGVRGHKVTTSMSSLTVQSTKSSKVQRPRRQHVVHFPDLSITSMASTATSSSSGSSSAYGFVGLVSAETGSVSRCRVSLPSSVSSSESKDAGGPSSSSIGHAVNPAITLKKGPTATSISRVESPPPPLPPKLFQLNHVHRHRQQVVKDNHLTNHPHPLTSSSSSSSSSKSSSLKSNEFSSSPTTNNIITSTSSHPHNSRVSRPTQGIRIGMDSHEYQVDGGTQSESDRGMGDSTLVAVPATVIPSSSPSASSSSSQSSDDDEEDDEGEGKGEREEVSVTSVSTTSPRRRRRTTTTSLDDSPISSSSSHHNHQEERMIYLDAMRRTKKSDHEIKVIQKKALLDFYLKQRNDRNLRGKKNHSVDEKEQHHHHHHHPRSSSSLHPHHHQQECEDVDQESEERILMMMRVTGNVTSPSSSSSSISPDSGISPESLESSTSTNSHETSHNNNHHRLEDDDDDILPLPPPPDDGVTNPQGIIAQREEETSDDTPLPPPPSSCLQVMPGFDGQKSLLVKSLSPPSMTRVSSHRVRQPQRLTEGREVIVNGQTKALSVVSRDHLDVSNDVRKVDDGQDHDRPRRSPTDMISSGEIFPRDSKEDEDKDRLVLSSSSYLRRMSSTSSRNDRLDLLTIEKMTLKNDYDQNEAQGTHIMSRLVECCSRSEVDKLTTHCNEVDTICRLVISLKTRLKNSPSIMTNDAGESLDKERRDKLSRQLNEALDLKKLIDERTESISVKILSKDGVSPRDKKEFVDFIRNKSVIRFRLEDVQEEILRLTNA